MTEQQPSPMTAIAGRERLHNLATGAKVLAVLKAASASGLVAQLEQPTSLDTLAASAPDLAPTTLQRVLTVLASAEMIVRDGETYALATDIRALATDVIGIDLDAVLSELLLEVRRAESVLSPARYPQGQDALTLAEVSGGRPVPIMIGLLSAVYEMLPAFRDRLADGGPFLDAGAGIGGNLLAAATTFPTLRAVGVEADELVVANLRARVDAAGLGARVEVLHGDIRTLELEPGSFAAAYWAQSFFPPDTRAASLAAVVRALSPGGVLVVQELFPAAADGDLDGQLDQLVMTSWGVAYGESLEAVGDELSAAGLTCDEPVATPLGRLLLAHKS